MLQGLWDWRHFAVNVPGIGRGMAYHPPMPDFDRTQSLSVLRWLVDAGADEAIGEQPLDRFAAGEKQRQAPAPVSDARQPAPKFSGREGGRNASAEAVSLATQPGAARALAASCTTLAELKVALESFEGCELKRQATKTVFADGAANSRIMLIGEAPGRDEDLAGLPFIGRAGKLLDRMLAEIGLDRTRVYITNVLPWRPPQNRDPSPEEAATCLPFLRRHIELARPEILVLLGAVSVRHVLGLTEGITRLRGKWEVYQTLGEEPRAIPALLTLHPAFLLRQPAAKRLAWRDLLSMREKIEQLGLA
jgi:uracil-DNA glycosylase family 4